MGNGYQFDVDAALFEFWKEMERTFKSKMLLSVDFSMLDCVCADFAAEYRDKAVYPRRYHGTFETEDDGA